MSFTTPDLSDENPDALALFPILKNLGGRKSFHGQIETLRCSDDNSFVKQLLNSEGKERILIVLIGYFKRIKHDQEFEIKV